MAPQYYNHNPPFFCHPHSLHELPWMFWVLTFPTFPHDQGDSHSTTRREQSNQNVLLPNLGWCLFDCLPSFHVECCMHLCKLSSSIHLFVVHFVTCHLLLTSQRFCSQKLFLLVTVWVFFFSPVSKHISQCLAWSSHFSQSPSLVKPVYLADKHFGTSYLLFLMPLTYSFFGIQMSTGRIKWKEACEVNSPVSAPIIGNVFVELQLSGAHRMSCGLWQLLNENISVTIRTKLGCFNVMSRWLRAEKVNSLSLTQEPFKHRRPVLQTVKV